MKATTLKGFKDYFAQDVQIREYIKDTFRNLALSYGYEGLETPSLEYSELILGISGAEAEKLYYRFKDHGDRDVMLKYELMTSMCRAVAQNVNEIQMPYKRYQMQNVWRADNVQKGRLREFTQLDIDTLGTNSNFSDAEILEIGLRFLQKLGFKKYVARISNRKILLGILEYLDIPESYFDGFYISVDKLKKIGEEEVKYELINVRGIESKKVEQIMKILKTRELEDLEKSIGTTETGGEGVNELKEILSILKETDLDPSTYQFDITLARGLASYTGPIWEYEILDNNIGSVSGGGRYDKIIGRYIGYDIYATGVSFGLERLQEIMKDNNMVKDISTTTDVLVVPMENKYIEYTIQIAQKLREKGIKTMVYPEIKKLGSVFKYADKKNFPWVIVIGEDEVSKKCVQLKNMKTQKQSTVIVEEAVKLINQK